MAGIASILLADASRARSVLGRSARPEMQLTDDQLRQRIAADDYHA